MAVEHVKSTPISNADAVPPVANTTGEGGLGYLREVSGFVTIPAASSDDTTLRFARVPTTAKIKAVKFSSQAQAAGAVNIGVYYPTTGRTGKPDLVANTIDEDFFASAVALTSASGLTDVTFEAAAAGYEQDEVNSPLWEALGLTSDPGGFFDIVGTLSTAVTTGTGVAVCSVQYVD